MQEVKEKIFAPLSCYREKFLRFIIELYHQGFAVLDIQEKLCMEGMDCPSEKELNHILDEYNRIYV